ncbi:MAG: hypothetical protein K6C33_08595 [Desulfovibrio sp.]|nr:hypothetical protein [Desulfovibrio sp.]
MSMQSTIPSLARTILPARPALPALSAQSALASVLALALAWALLLAPGDAQAARWPVKGGIVQQKIVKDRLGAGQVIYTEERNDSGNLQTRLLHAYRFTGDPEEAELVWLVNDGVERCPADVDAHFAAKAPVTTDLDEDGLLEIWTGYVTRCAGDVSPKTLKIIMYEGRNKHAMRGTTLVEVEPGHFEGGTGEMDTAFRTGPAAFRKYAEKLWSQWRSDDGRAGTRDSWPVKGEVLASEPIADRLGEGAVVYSREVEEKDDWKTMLLHAYRFSGEPGSASRIWQINDGVERCELDAVTASFLGDGPFVTDLDRDGIKEIWTVFTYGCAGDPGPIDLKIIMYEGKTKYAMRGETWARVGDGIMQGGEGKMDDAFRSGPAVFRRYAEKLWQRFRMGRDAS